MIGRIGTHRSSRLAAGSCQLSFGKLYSLLPTKQLLLASLALFAAGSLLCSLAPTSVTFIVGRAVTGVATAGVVSGAFAFVCTDIIRMDILLTGLELSLRSRHCISGQRMRELVAPSRPLRL